MIPISRTQQGQSVQALSAGGSTPSKPVETDTYKAKTMNLIPDFLKVSGNDMGAKVLQGVILTVASPFIAGYAFTIAIGNAWNKSKANHLNDLVKEQKGLKEEITEWKKTIDDHQSETTALNKLMNACTVDQASVRLNYMSEIAARDRQIQPTKELMKACEGRLAAIELKLSTVNSKPERKLTEDMDIELVKLNKKQEVAENKNEKKVQKFENNVEQTLIKKDIATLRNEIKEKENLIADQKKSLQENQNNLNRLSSSDYSDKNKDYDIARLKQYDNITEKKIQKDENELLEMKKNLENIQLNLELKTNPDGKSGGPTIRKLNMKIFNPD